MKHSVFFFTSFLCCRFFCFSFSKSKSQTTWHSKLFMNVNEINRKWITKRSKRRRRKNREHTEEWVAKNKHDRICGCCIQNDNSDFQKQTEKKLSRTLQRGGGGRWAWAPTIWKKVLAVFAVAVVSSINVHWFENPRRKRTFRWDCVRARAEQKKCQTKISTENDSKQHKNKTP